jgi:hypothetical protein
MNLLPGNVTLRKYCQSVQTSIQNQTELASCTIKVVIASEADLNENLLLADNPAGSKLNSWVILVNLDKFFTLSTDEERNAVLAHEVGHFMCEKYGAPERINSADRALVEALADYWACQWGYYNAIKRIRQGRCIAQYCDILDDFGNVESFLKRIKELYFTVGTKESDIQFCK